MLDMTGLDDGFSVIGEIPKCSDTLVCGLTHIRRGTSSRSHELGDFILKRKERRDVCRGARDTLNVKMDNRSEGKAEIDNFLKNCVNSGLTFENIRFVFRSSTRISSFFPFKDKVPKLMRSGVVYLFKCRCCSASYVVQTTHQSIRTLGNLSYNRKTIIQSSHVQHFLSLKLYRSLCQL